MIATRQEHVRFALHLTELLMSVIDDMKCERLSEETGTCRMRGDDEAFYCAKCLAIRHAQLVAKAMQRQLDEMVKAPSALPALGSKTCAPCPARQKITLNVLHVRPEADCGIPDSALADFMNFELDVTSGRPVIQAKFCSWCGGLIDPSTLLKVVDVQGIPPDAPSAM